MPAAARYLATRTRWSGALAQDVGGVGAARLLGDPGRQRGVGDLYTGDVGEAHAGLQEQLDHGCVSRLVPHGRQEPL